MQMRRGRRKDDGEWAAERTTLPHVEHVSWKQVQNSQVQPYSLASGSPSVQQASPCVHSAAECKAMRQSCATSTFVSQLALRITAAARRRVL